MSMAEMAGLDDLVAKAARAGDHDRYLTALYAPAEKRAALLALYAFNAEIAGIRDRIREPLPGELRLQWWRDTLDPSRAEAASGHPVADALNGAIAAHRLPRPAFANYLEARVFDLYDDPMSSRTDLEGYCGETAGAMIQLAALVLDAGSAPGFADLAGRAGCAQAMTGLLQLLPLHRARGQCFLPRDMLSAAGSSPEEFVTGDSAPAALRAVEAMIALASEHFESFRQGAGLIPPALRPAFLPLALTGLDLARMKAPAQVLRGIGEGSRWRKQWTLLRHASRGWKAA